MISERKKQLLINYLLIRGIKLTIGSLSLNTKWLSFRKLGVCFFNTD